jgi:phage terminase Nu1 subunit (DNA packaging protein)
MATQTLAERVDILRPTGVTPLLTTAQLMARYGVSNWTVNEWVKAGCPLEPTAFRGRRFDLDRVRAWHAAQQQATELTSV